MPARSLLAPCAAALLCAGLAACGTSKPLPAPRFLARADAICAQANNAHPAPAAPANAQAAEAQSREQAKLRSELLDKLAALAPPEPLLARFRAYRSQTRTIIAGTRAEAAAAHRQDRERFNALDQTVARQLAARAKLAAQIGFRVCGRPRSRAASSALPDPAIYSADSICAGVDALVRTAAPARRGAGDLRAIVGLHDRTYPALSASLPRLKALSPTAAHRGAYQRFIAAYQRRVALAPKQRAAAHAGNRKALAALASADAAAHTAEAAAARQLGMTVCAARGGAGV